MLCSTTACPAVVGLDLGQRQGPVGDEGVVVPGGEQRQLRARGRADPAHLAGVPLVAGEHGERDLGDVGARDLWRAQPVRDRLPRVLVDRLDRGARLARQARAPARRVQLGEGIAQAEHKRGRQRVARSRPVQRHGGNATRPLDD